MQRIHVGSLCLQIYEWKYMKKTLHVNFTYPLNVKFNLSDVYVWSTQGNFAVRIITNKPSTVWD